MAVVFLNSSERMVVILFGFNGEGNGWCHWDEISCVLFLAEFIAMILDVNDDFMVVTYYFVAEISSCEAYKTWICTRYWGQSSRAP